MTSAPQPARASSRPSAEPWASTPISVTTNVPAPDPSRSSSPSTTSSTGNRRWWYRSWSVAPPVHAIPASSTTSAASDRPRKAHRARRRARRKRTARVSSGGRLAGEPGICPAYRAAPALREGGLSAGRGIERGAGGRLALQLEGVMDHFQGLVPVLTGHDARDLDFRGRDVLDVDLRLRERFEH